jgi:O-acetyl-ADP-ribose deacetylase (regulator of RNase III)
MPLIYSNTDITTVTDGLIGHGCNCQGVMGAGVALAIRKRWPVVYNEYKKLVIGRSLVGETQIVRVSQHLVVANCFTQEFYGRKLGHAYASLDAIESCLRFCYEYQDDEHIFPIEEYHFSMIGCSLGGLDWETQVLPIFENLNIKYNKTTIIHHI